MLQEPPKNTEYYYYGNYPYYIGEYYPLRVV